MPPLKLTADILAAALEGFEAQKNCIDARMAEIRQMLGGGTAPAVSTDAGKPLKKRSAAVHRRMKLAQQLRWQKIKASNSRTPRPRSQRRGRYVLLVENQS
jgi:hypothetical protein